MTFSFSRATREDIPAIRQIIGDVLPSIQQSFLSPEATKKLIDAKYTESILLSETNDKHIFFGIAKDEKGTIVGTQSAKLLENNVLYLYRGYVLPACQGQGIVSTLITQAIRYFAPIKKLRTEIEQHNQHSIDVFTKKGFVLVGDRIDNVNGVSRTLHILEKKLI